MNEPSITLIDEALRDYQVIWAAAGHPHAVFPSTYQELLKASGAKAARVGN
jgi:prolyl-tRNA editing enzyme YbaK/EbsC (Cys-tRNA(Pro) deacylase)